jgi:hypothetical protein
MSSNSTYVDDLTIEDDSPLWRRIPSLHFFYDENQGRIRPSSAAFEDHKNGSPMSVILGREVIDNGRSAESLLVNHSGYGLVSFLAGLARENKQGIVRKPIPEEPAHAEVFGNKTKSIRNALAKNSKWVVPPPIVE